MPIDGCYTDAPWDGGVLLSLCSKCALCPSVLLLYPCRKLRLTTSSFKKAWLSTLTDLKYAGIRRAEYGDTAHGPEKSPPLLSPPRQTDKQTVRPRPLGLDPG